MRIKIPKKWNGWHHKSYHVDPHKSMYIWRHSPFLVMDPSDLIIWHAAPDARAWPHLQGTVSRSHHSSSTVSNAQKPATNSEACAYAREARTSVGHLGKGKSPSFPVTRIVHAQ